MDTRILEYFLAVAREENITRAAALLRQPPCWPPAGRSVRRRGVRGSTHARQMDS